MNDHKAIQTPHLLSSSNSIIISVIENYRKVNSYQLSDAIESLKGWANEQKNLIENTSSVEEKKKLQDDVLFQMEAVLKVYLLLNKTLPDIDNENINKICDTAFLQMFKLLDQNIKSILACVLEKTGYRMYLMSQDNGVLPTQEELEKLRDLRRTPLLIKLKGNHENENSFYIYANYAESGFRGLCGAKEGCLTKLETNQELNELDFNNDDTYITVTKNAEAFEEIRLKIEDAPKNFLNYSKIEKLLETLQQHLSHPYFALNYFDKRFFKQDIVVIDVYLNILKTLLLIPSLDLAESFKEYIERLKHDEFLENWSEQLNKGIEIASSSKEKMSYILIMMENVLDKYDDISHHHHDSQIDVKANKKIYEDIFLTLFEMLDDDIKNKFKHHFEKSNDPLIFKTQQCIQLIKQIKYDENTDSTNSLSTTPMTVYFDSGFLENLLHWQIIIEHNKLLVQTQKGSKKNNPFIIGFISKNETFTHPEKLEIQITFNNYPFPDKTFKLFKHALETKNIKFNEIYRGLTIQIDSIKNKSELFSIMEIINRFANFNKNDYEKLDSIIGFVEPKPKITDLVELKKYDLAIEEAHFAEKKGFENYVYELAEFLYENHIYDKALDAYNSIEENNPHYQEAKIKCLDILTKSITLISLDKNILEEKKEEEKIKYMEFQFLILTDICKFDVNYTRQKDLLFSELCGNKGISALNFNIKPNIKTLLNLAKEMRILKAQHVSKSENIIREPEKEKTAWITTTQGIFAHSQIVIQDTPSTQNTSINTTSIKEYIELNYGCKVLSIESNNKLEIKLETAISEDLEKILSKYNNVYYAKNNCGVCMTNQNEILDFVETLKILLESKKSINSNCSSTL